MRDVWYRGHDLFYVINALSLLFILHIVSKSKLVFIVVFSALFSILITFEAYYGFFFKNGITLGIVIAIMETNVAEAAGAMEGRVLQCIILFCLSFFLIFKSTSELKKMNINVKWSVLILSVYLFVFFPLFIYRRIKVDKRFAAAFKYAPVIWTQTTVTERLPLLYGQIASVIVYLNEKNKSKKYLLQERILLEGVIRNDTVYIPEKIFFVVGESQYRKHLSLYGYDIKTTPFLDSLS